ncbi:hypothetical protein BD779DRAFT_66207 [Infundibulicybe gibba]|nr:hypothetical protein BD779DRAFT_66207 [Infundibulicybe gibba]
MIRSSTYLFLNFLLSTKLGVQQILTKVEHEVEAKIEVKFSIVKPPNDYTILMPQYDCPALAMNVRYYRPRCHPTDEALKGSDKPAERGGQPGSSG